ncbi:MAG: GHMP kinase [Bacteroidia bacterium]|nr:GHMP kinase [Bacteroidia bacterium]
MYNYYSRGKLLITGEYTVLDGALAFAIPSKFGQSLTVEPLKDPKLVWESITKDGKIWFKGSFSIENDIIVANQQNEISDRLVAILNAANKLNKQCLNSNTGLKITTKLEFSRSWGLGTSSTLINNIASWFNIDPYELLEKTFGGSGYDIACALRNSALTYLLKGNEKRINSLEFNPKFKQQLFFIHLNKKQDSRKGIATYNLQKKEVADSISEISKITSKLIECKNLKEFEKLITQHEVIISGIIKINPIKERLFKDFPGAIKSLGAWGGDFILATGNLEEMKYFKNKGYSTILSFKDILV